MTTKGKNQQTLRKQFRDLLLDAKSTAAGSPEREAVTDWCLLNAHWIVNGLSLAEALHDITTHKDFKR
jgi:hypothetical protein